MLRRPHENVATVLVDPQVLADLELRLVGSDLWLWPVANSPIVLDGPRRAFQLRRQMIQARRGAWDVAMQWTPVWISFGESWRTGDEPLPWSAHVALWSTLAEYADHVRYRKCLGGVPPLLAEREGL